MPRQWPSRPHLLNSLSALVYAAMHPGCGLTAQHWWQKNQRAAVTKQRDHQSQIAFAHEIPCHELVTAERHESVKQPYQFGPLPMCSHPGERQRQRGRIIRAMAANNPSRSANAILYTGVLARNDLRKRFRLTFERWASLPQNMAVFVQAPSQNIALEVERPIVVVRHRRLNIGNRIVPSARLNSAGLPPGCALMITFNHPLRSPLRQRAPGSASARPLRRVRRRPDRIGPSELILGPCIIALVWNC
jgi:hypothetical protein